MREGERERERLRGRERERERERAAAWMEGVREECLFLWCLCCNDFIS